MKNNANGFRSGIDFRQGACAALVVSGLCYITYPKNIMTANFISHGQNKCFRLVGPLQHGITNTWAQEF